MNRSSLCTLAAILLLSTGQVDAARWMVTKSGGLLPAPAMAKSQAFCQDPANQGVVLVFENSLGTTPASGSALETVGSVGVQADVRVDAVCVGGPVTLRLRYGALAGGTATAPSDYLPFQLQAVSPALAIFAPATTFSASSTISIVDDAIEEAMFEELQIGLLGGEILTPIEIFPVPAAAEVLATIIIEDDDAPLPIEVAVNPPNGGSASCTPNPVAPGGSSTCSATANAGFTFDGWAGDCSGASCTLENVQSAKSVIANFVPITFPITVAASPASGGSASCTPNPVVAGGTSTCLATANPGFTFSGWSGDCSGQTCSLSNVQSARSVTANFTGDTYIISATSVPANGGTTSCTPASVAFDDSSVCTATPATGFAFEAWDGDCAFAGASPECRLDGISADQNVIARYVATGPDLSPDGITDMVTTGLGSAPDPLASAAIAPLAENCSTATDAAVIAQCEAIVNLAGAGQAAQLTQILRAISGEELSAQVTSAIDAGNQRGAQIDGRIAALRGGATGISLDEVAFNYRGSSLPLGMMFNAVAANGENAADEGFGGGLLDQRLGAFLNVTALGGNRDASEFEVGFDFEGYSVLGGVDWRFSDTFIAGAAVGWSDLSSDLDFDGGGLDSQGWSLTGYGTWLLSERAYIDFSVGKLWNEYDQTRLVDLRFLGPGFGSSTAVGQTDADQTSFSFGGGWDIPFGEWVYSPRGSLLWSESSIDGFTESGADINDLIFDEQNIDSLIWTFTQSVARSFSVSAGALQPYASLDLSRETRNEGFSISPRLRVRPEQRSTPIFIEESDRFFARADIGVSFVGSGGFQWFASYSRLLGYDKVQAWAFRGGLRMEF
jgi:outer membrane autotransporter protein